MREQIDARFGECDGIVLVENMRRDLDAVLMCFVDGRPRKWYRKPRRPTAPVVDPDLDDIDLSRSLFLHRPPYLVFRGHRIGEVGVDRIARPRVRCANAAAGGQQACAAGASCGLIGTDLAGNVVAPLDAERLYGGNAEI